MNDNVEIGQRIKYYRKLAGLTQEQLAQKTGLSQNYISMLEQNKVGFSKPTLEKIAQALNISVGDLFKEGTKEPESSLPDSLLSDPDFIIHFSAYQKFKSLPEGEQKEALRKVLESYVKAVEAAKKVEEGRWKK